MPTRHARRSPRSTTAFVVFAALSAAACSDSVQTPVEPEGGTVVAGPTLSADMHPTVVGPVATGLEGASGSAIGPGGDLYVTEGAAGRISRIDLKTGETVPFAWDLPPALIPVGGVIDVAFIGSNPYALVTLVGPELGGTDVSGLYRIDGETEWTVIADIGQWSWDNPPATPFDVPSGLQYSLEPFRGGFLVTDGHHNRVLWVSLDGEISEMIQFGNIVPTGLAVWGNRVFMGEAGPSPHDPADGKVVAFRAGSNKVTEFASGQPLIVDVEFGIGHQIFALAQGPWEGGFPGAPSLPSSGSLLKVTNDGGFEVLAGELDRPTSMEIVGTTAYVVTMAGEVVQILNVR